MKYRIELPMPIFPIHTNKKGDPIIISHEDHIDYGRKIIISPYSGMVRKVEYTENIELLEPQFVSKLDEEYEAFDFAKLGRYKRVIWSFEQEWRFILSILPFDSNKKEQEMIDLMVESVRKGIPPSVSQYLVEIDDEAFSKMKIRLGPRIQSGDFEIVKSLLNQYNPTAALETSSLESDIR